MFNSKKDRANHIRDFYGNLYKKRLDRLLSIEDFLTNEITGRDDIRNRKLTEDEKNTLEGNITVAESVSLNLTTATAREITDINSLVKLTPVITSGGNITVAEAVSINLTTATAREITDVNNLTSLAATFATSYAVTDGVPIATGNNSGSGSGTTTTLSQLWYMG